MVLVKLICFYTSPSRRHNKYTPNIKRPNIMCPCAVIMSSGHIFVKYSIIIHFVIYNNYCSERNSMLLMGNEPLGFS